MSEVNKALDAAKLLTAGFEAIARATSTPSDDRAAGWAEDVLAVVTAIVHAVQDGLARNVSAADVTAALAKRVDALASNDAAALAALRKKFGR